MPKSLEGRGEVAYGEPSGVSRRLKYDKFWSGICHHRKVRVSMSLLHGIFLAAFLLFDVIVFVTCVLYVQKRHAKLAAEKGLSYSVRDSGSLGAAMFVEFALMWSAGVLLLDYVMYIRDAAKQLQTVSYVAVDGEITKCREIVKQESEGSSRELDVEFKYRVDGLDYRGTVVRYLKSATYASLSEFMAKHPVGTRVAVYYDPAAPTEAVLLPGVDGTEILVPLVLLPFNVVMFAFWGACIVYGIHGNDEGFRIYHGIQFFDQEVARVRLSHFTPVAGAVLALGIVPIPVYVGIALWGTPASVAAAVVAWIMVIGSAAAAYYYLSVRAASGRFDLVIDRLQRMLTLPTTYGRAEPIHVPLTHLLAVEIVAKTDDEKRVWHSANIKWRSGRGEPQESKIAEWSDQGQAEELVAWVKAKVEFAR